MDEMGFEPSGTETAGMAGSETGVTSKRARALTG